MNDLGAPGGKDTPDDEILLADIGRFLDEFDPPPDDLVHRVQFALALENLDVEVARWEPVVTLAGGQGSDTRDGFDLSNISTAHGVSPGI
jgi:hypothetical protein